MRAVQRRKDKRTRSEMYQTMQAECSRAIFSNWTGETLRLAQKNQLDGLFSAIGSRIIVDVRRQPESIFFPLYDISLIAATRNEVGSRAIGAHTASFSLSNCGVRRFARQTRRIMHLILELYRSSEDTNRQVCSGMYASGGSRDPEINGRSK